MTEVQKNTKYHWGCEETASLTRCWGGYKLLQPLWKQCSVSYDSKQQLLYDPEKALLDIYPRENDNLCSYRNQYMNVPAQTGNSPGVPQRWSVEWWHTCTMESYSAPKMNDTWNTWAESWGSYSEWKKPIPKAIYQMIPFLEQAWKDS